MLKNQIHETNLHIRYCGLALCVCVYVCVCTHSCMHIQVHIFGLGLSMCIFKVVILCKACIQQKSAAVNTTCTNNSAICAPLTGFHRE